MHSLPECKKMKTNIEASQVEKKIDDILYDVKNKAKQVGAWDYHATYLGSVVKEIALDGLWMEFGVYRGRSLTFIASQTKNIVYGFDSFEGLPEKWNDENPLGVYSLAGQAPNGAIDGSNDDNPGMYDSSPTRIVQPWKDNIKLVKGYFDKTLPRFLELYQGDAAFINIDSDLYSSAVTVLQNLAPRIKVGTIISFDELCDYAEFREHEIKAFAEFLLETGHEYEPLYHQNLGSYAQASFRIIK